jgi:hypothetical protein
LWSTDDPEYGQECCRGCQENATEWLAVNGQPGDVPGCFRTSDKKGPCVVPCPTLSQRAEEVLDLFGESFTAVVGGMGIGMAPNRATAALVAEACGIHPTAGWWFLFGDLERAWIEQVNKKPPANE